MSVLMNSDRAMSCPICLDTLSVPIKQCQTGHSMCGGCITMTRIDKCPICRGPLSEVRNYQLEQVIEGFKDVLRLSCIYAAQGCKFTLTQQERETHQAECRFRKFDCVGRTFAKWKCNWKGNFQDIHQHFREAHGQHKVLEYKTESAMKISFEHNFWDVRVISFFNGQQLFYFKHKVDVAKKKAYWSFQLVGTRNQARSHYYEFEVLDGIRKFKVTEICETDTTDVNEIFNKEKCVVMSFQSIKNYTDQNGDLNYKFRIMAIKKPSGLSK